MTFVTHKTSEKNIRATNPTYTLALVKPAHTGAVDVPSSEAQLSSSLYFDFRTVIGGHYVGFENYISPTFFESLFDLASKVSCGSEYIFIHEQLVHGIRYSFDG